MSYYPCLRAQPAPRSVSRMRRASFARSSAPERPLTASSAVMAESEQRPSITFPSRGPTDESPPPLWTREASTDEHVAYERPVDTTTGPVLVRLSASRTPRSCPPGSETTGWTLRAETRGREALSAGTTSRVVTRTKAVRALFGAMRRVNDVVRSDEESTATSAALLGRLPDQVDGW